MNATDETYDEWCARWKQEWDASVQANRVFNDVAIDRLVTAVGSSPSDRGALADELERLQRIYSFWRDANDQPPNGEIRKWLSSFVNTVRKVRTLLIHPPDDDPDFLAKLIFTAGQDRHDISQVRRAVHGIQVLEATFGRLLRDNSYGLDRIAPPATHWLLGKALPRAYEQHFGKQFAYTRDKEVDVISGPAIRFILEVLLTMKVDTPRDGKPFGPDAVEYYLRLAGY
jgi:hypothetical protein